VVSISGERGLVDRGNLPCVVVAVVEGGKGSKLMKAPFDWKLNLS